MPHSLTILARGRMPFSPSLLLTVAAALAFAWVCGRLVHAIGQPPVIGELVAGIVLGPSVFGAAAPALYARAFTPETITTIGWLARAAVLVFMFLVGLELDRDRLREHAGGVARIAVVNLLVPFALGLGLALTLTHFFGGAGPNRVAFLLFIATAMSITALPVLTRILTDWRMLTTTIGTIATGCAAIDDVVAWTLLGIVNALVKGDANPAVTIVSSAVYVFVMLGVVRPVMTRLSAASDWLILLLAIVVTVGSAYVTELIGIHAIFGTFIAGVCMPRRSNLLRGIDRLLLVISTLLLPAFFVLVGLRTQLGVMHDAETWLLTIVIVVLATAGKLGASSLAARSAGFAWRDAIAIGALLNTRGLVSLVALDLGRTLGVLSPPLFTMFVLMTFVTTFATVPALRLLGFRPLK